MPARFETTVTAVNRCGRDVIELALTFPSAYSFTAGQWFRLFAGTSEGEQARTFSHASAPSDSEIRMATRLSGSAFKKALSSVAVGDRFEISAAGGRLSLPRDARSLTFLTGGVGVTPVRSLLRAAVDEGREFDDALVVFGVRDEECAPYLDDLAALQASGVHLVVVCEHPSPSWMGERGFITAEIVTRYGGVSVGRPFVVTGPPKMVEAMEGVLDELGVPEALRIIERFGPARAGP